MQRNIADAEITKKIADLLKSGNLSTEFQCIQVLSGGMTNQTFKVTTDRPLVVRLAGNTEGIINREAEQENVKTLQGRDITVDVLYSDASGNQVSEWVDAKTMSPKRLRKPKYLQKIVALLKKLHELPVSFANEVNVFERNRIFLSVLQKADATAETDLTVLTKQQTIERLSSAFLEKSVRAHNDTIYSNFLFSKIKGILAIDLEYSGDNPGGPFPDLANLSLEVDFSPEEDKKLLTLYFGEADEVTYSRLLLYKANYAYYVNLWARVQLVNRNYQDEDGKQALIELASKRLADYNNIINDPEFKNALTILDETLNPANKKSALAVAMVPYGFFFNASIGSQSRSSVPEISKCKLY